MPSYYDSTKSKPGKAALKYKEGGQVSEEEFPLLKAATLKYKSDTGALDQIMGSIPGTEAYKEKREYLSKVARQIQKKKNLKKRRKGASLGQLSDKQLALLKKDVLKPTKAKAAFKAAGGGKVKKMAGGGTVARGSGAARPQTFRKNG